MYTRHKCIRLHNFLSCVIAESEDALTPPSFFLPPPPPPPVPPDFASRHLVALDSMNSL